MTDHPPNQPTIRLNNAAQAPRHRVNPPNTGYVIERTKQTIERQATKKNRQASRECDLLINRGAPNMGIITLMLN